MLHRGSRNLQYDSYLGRRMKTGLQDKASSPRSPAGTDSEFAAALAAQLAAQAQRFHKVSPANADDDFGKSLAAKLAARSERLRAAASSTPAPDIGPREATDRFSSLLASVGVGHIWVGFLLLMLFAGAAVVAVWGLPFPPSEPLPSSHIEQAKAAVPRADAMPGKAPPPTSAPVVSPPPASPSPATSSQPPPVSSAPQIPLVAQAKSAPLKADEIRELQGKLKALGFDPGPVDGVVGPMTLSAVRKFSEARAIANPEATKDLLVRLRSESPPKK
jgi:Putative peptidoglycan binding domain